MKNTYYVSIEGLQKLKGELAERETTLRKQIGDAIGTAKDQGDLSENFEYQDAKERQVTNETRIIELKDMIAKSVVVEAKAGATEIMIGSTFDVEIGGMQKTFSIVGETESDPLAGKISHESPLGDAFMGHSAGDTVEVDAPAGKIAYKIISLK